MKQWLCAMAGAVLMAGCASADKGGTDAVVQLSEDKATGVKRIAFAPQPLDCEQRMHCPTVGVRWSSTTPKRAVLLVGFNDAMQGAVEEIVFHARPHAPLRVRSKARGVEDVAGVTALDVPMETLERVAFGKGTWVEVMAGGKTYREDMATGERKSRADDALKRLMVEAYKGTEKEISLSLSDMFAKPYER